MFTEWSKRLDYLMALPALFSIKYKFSSDSYVFIWLKHIKELQSLDLYHLALKIEI